MNFDLISGTEVNGSPFQLERQYVCLAGNCLSVNSWKARAKIHLHRDGVKRLIRLLSKPLPTHNGDETPDTLNCSRQLDMFMSRSADQICILCISDNNDVMFHMTDKYIGNFIKYLKDRIHE